MTRRLAALALGLALVTSCNARPATLSVDLVTDLVPGVEFFSVRTTVATVPSTGPSENALAVLGSGEDTIEGARVAEFRALPLGGYRARVELLDRFGAPLVERGVDVRLTGNYAMRVVISRDCVTVSCPGTSDPEERTECLAGRCVVPTCVVASECMSRECETDGDCPVPSASCAVADCLEGVCLEVEVPGTCDDGLACDPDDGCVVIPDPPGDGGLGGDGSIGNDGSVERRDAGSGVPGDDDGDGIPAAEECNDGDPSIHPGAPEDCGDGIDQDCSGSDLPCPPDLDGDLWDADADCDDASAAIHPGAIDLCGNAIDEDCDTFDLPCGAPDADGDGWPAPIDCNDASSTVYPYAFEICGDGVDQDCSGADRPAPCTGGYLQTCSPGRVCLESRTQHLACVNNVCARCCVFCDNRRRFHWVNVDHDCAAAARDYCEIGDRGGLSTTAPDPIQWGGCAP